VFINGKQIDEIPMINFPKIACNEPMDPYNNNNKKKNIRGHQLEFHKSQGYWRLTWSLTSRLVRLVEVRTNWFGHPY
jgi:hypothetical protein